MLDVWIQHGLDFKSSNTDFEDYSSFIHVFTFPDKANITLTLS